MLVCNVSLRPPRHAIAADLVEAITASDATATGNIVFATLVDDPASVGDFVDAYSGEIMIEAASAVDAPDAGFLAVYAADVAEVTTAVDTPDGALAVSYVTFDSGTLSSVTLSGGNLVATNTGTTTDHGARVATASGKASGKYYFELTLTTIQGTGGGDQGVGVGTTASTYSGMGNGGGVTGVHMYISGNIWANGSNSGSTLGARSTSNVIGIAVDRDNSRIWFRAAPSGNWNGSGAANPATNTGGVTLPAGTMVPFLTFGGSFAAASNVVTANFGASAFAGSVPSGFTSGWTA